MPEVLKVQLHGETASPTLVYLPGLHGDWTLIGGFRKAIGGHARFIEIMYPRTLDWSLDDYAANVETALARVGIQRGWLLGESFSSQVVWSLCGRKRFLVEGIILAGGFARHPIRWAVRLAESIGGRVPLSWIVRILFAYAWVARIRFRRSPETLAGVEEFIARRTELDRQAATHRLHLIAQNDPCGIIHALNVPVYGLSGFLDPVVPWILARGWLRRHCPALRDFKIIWRADHNVLSTAPESAAEQVLRWIENPPADP